MTATENLLEKAKNLPEQLVAELLDFAEFLQNKEVSKQRQSQDCLLIDLRGGLEHSDTFSEDPLVIQNRCRDEWR